MSTFKVIFSWKGSPINPWLISLGSGVLLSLSFPPVNASFLSFIGFLGLYHLVVVSHNWRHLAMLSYPAFLVWNLGTTYWLMMASIPAGVAAIVANSALMIIPLAIIRFLHHRYHWFGWTALAQAATWVLYEYLHHHWDLAWPWLALGNAWSNQITMIQYVSWTGHLGISFWVTFSSFLMAHWLLLARKSQKHHLLLYLSFLGIPAGSMIFYYSTAKNLQLPSSPSTGVLVTQPNHDSYQDYGGMSGPDEVLDSLFTLSSQLYDSTISLIVWPENAIDKPIQMNSRHAFRIADTARSWNTNFIIGTGLYTLYPDQKPSLYRTTSNGMAYNAYNATLFADSTGHLSRYDKANLVPFVERFPFVDALNTLDVGNWIDWGKHAGFGKGTEANMLSTPSFSTPGLVCYDSVFPSWNREFVLNGAQFLTIITNDGWWGESSGHLQHFAYARLRAIEFRRWVVRSANNGTSGIIRPDGSIEQKTEYWTRTSFTSRIPLRNDVTIYAQWGDWLAMFSFFMVLLSVGYGRLNKG